MMAISLSLFSIIEVLWTFRSTVFSYIFCLFVVICVSIEKLRKKMKDYHTRAPPLPAPGRVVAVVDPNIPFLTVALCLEW